MQEIRPHLKLPCPPPFSTAAMSALLELPADTSSTTTASYKKPAHRRDSSDELDVFEAASYYSGVDDTSFRISGILPYRSMNEERRTALGGAGGMRRSVDAPISRAAPPLPPQSHKTSETKPAKEKETTTTKQPISPGGRLASFLNAFFHQGSSKKKSKSISATTSSTTQNEYSCKDGDHLLESPRGRRKRRSSISSTHSRSSTVGRSSEPSFFSSSGSGFRTPTLVFPRGKAKEEYPRTGPALLLAGAAATVHASNEEIRSCGYGDLPWGRSRRASTNGILEKGSGCSYYGAEKSAVLGGGGVAEKKWVLNEDSRGIACKNLLRGGGADGALAKERSLWRSREEDEDDGGESDSSSDLFELPNCDLQVHHFASGLPVYETTRMETIKRGSSSSMASVAL